MLTPNFQKTRAGSFQRFQDHWKDFRKVALRDVRKAHGKNNFTMTLTYTTKSGTVTEPNKVLFALTCDLLPDKLPWAPANLGISKLMKASSATGISFVGSATERTKHIRAGELSSAGSVKMRCLEAICDPHPCRAVCLALGRCSDCNMSLQESM